jgi:hypothetical protein
MLTLEYVQNGGKRDLAIRVIENFYLFAVNTHFAFVLFLIILYIKLIYQFFKFVNLNRSYIKYDFETETSPILEKTKELMKNHKLFSRFYNKKT